MKQRFRVADPIESLPIETKAKLASTRLLQLKSEVYRIRPCLVYIDTLLGPTELARLRTLPYDILTIGADPTRQVLEAGGSIVAAYWPTVDEKGADDLQFLIATPDGELTGNMRISMDSFNDNYPHISGGEWDGSSADAARKLGALLRYGFVVPLAEAQCPQFHILTQLWRPSSNRRWRELCAALRRNAENPYVSAIHVLMETEAAAEAWAKWPAELQAKVRAKPYAKRLNYCDARTIMMRDMPSDAFMGLINADIYFDESLRDLWAADMSGGRCFALLRYDTTLEQAEKGEGAEPKIFGPRDDSQDAWIFPGPTLCERAAAGENWDTLNFTLGQAGCDNAFAGELVRRRWIVANPCMSIRTMHVHESGVRTYREDDRVTLGIYATLAPCGLLESRLMRAANFVTHSTLKVNTLKGVHIAPWTGGARGAEAYQRGLSDIYKTLDKERIVDAADKVEWKEESVKLLGATDATVTPDGLVSVGDGIGFSDDRQASELAWAQTPYNSLSPVVCEDRGLFLPFSDGTLGDEILNVGRALWVHEHLGGAVCLPSHYGRLIAPLLASGGKAHLTLCNLGEKALYCKQAYGFLPSFVHGGAAWLQPAVAALRQAFSVVVDGDAANGYVMYGLAEALDDYLDAELEDVTVLLKSTAPARLINTLKGAKVCVSQVAGGKFLWAMSPGGTYIDLAPTSAAAMIANICGVKYIPLTFKGDDLPEDMGRVVLEAIRGATATNGTTVADGVERRIVYMPRPRQGYHGHPGDSFRELVELWAEAGYIERRYHDGVFIWLDEVGAGGKLLYDRDLLEWMDSAPEEEKSWKQALFGNEQSEKGKPWIYWARRPRLLEKRRPLDSRSRSLVFYGRIENSKQFKLRSAKSTGIDWSAVCEEFVMPVGGQYKYTQAEYLDRLAEAKFGLCLPGYGPKCHREIECMALGVVPVITPGIDTAGYAEPLVEGVHYLLATNPEAAQVAIASCTEEQWVHMSAAGRAWYERNASVAGSWEITQKLLAEAEAASKVQ